MNATVNVWTKIPKEFQFRCYSVPVILTMHQNEMDHFLFIIWPKTKNPKLHWVPFSSPSFLSISTKNKGKFHKHPYWFPFLTRIHCPWSSWCTRQFLGRTHWPESGHLLAKPSSVENQFLFTYNPSLMLYFKIKHLFFILRSWEVQ